MQLEASEIVRSRLGSRDKSAPVGQGTSPILLSERIKWRRLNLGKVEKDSQFSSVKIGEKHLPHHYSDRPRDDRPIVDFVCRQVHRRKSLENGTIRRWLKGVETIVTDF